MFIVDRLKDIVIRGGENISCLEVEQAIYAHPGVAEVAVFGVPDAMLGEVPMAVWVAREGPGTDGQGTDGSAPGEADLRAFIGAHLAPFKLPARLMRVAGPLPRLGSEKFDKRSIKTHYAPLLRHADAPLLPEPDAS